jgi:hypothetical protein
VPNADSTKELAQFDRKQADLAMLRTDSCNRGWRKNRLPRLPNT